MIKGWIINNIDRRPLLVVKYEDLKSDKLTQVKRMLDFLGVPYSDELLEQRLSKGFGKFKRKHSAEEFDHFTAGQREGVTNRTMEIIELLRQRNSGETYGIDQYLGS